MYDIYFVGKAPDDILSQYFVESDIASSRLSMDWNNKSL